MLSQVFSKSKNQPVAGPQIGKTANILVVDDDSCMRKLLAQHLSEAGYDVLVAEDAVTAGNLILSAPPDLMIVDANIAGLGGIGFVELLKKDQSIPSIPVIVSAGRREAASKAKALGAAAYLTKPIVVDDLLRKVGRHAPKTRIASCTGMPLMRWMFISC